MKTQGNTILITGGGSGIGLALAKAFATAENRVIICGRNPEKLASVKADMPSLQTIQCDITNDDDVVQLVSKVTANFGQLNMLVNNAGVLQMTNFADAGNQLQDIENEINTNFLAPVKLTRQLLPRLVKQPESAIINVSSGLAYVPMASAAVYCATKAAIHSWSRSLRHQLASTSIKVFEVLPPTVETAMTDTMETSKISPATLAHEVMASLRNDTTEIRIGQTRFLYLLSRLAPRIGEKILLKA